MITVLSPKINLSLSCFYMTDLCHKIFSGLYSLTHARSHLLGYMDLRHLPYLEN